MWLLLLACSDPPPPPPRPKPVPAPVPEPEEDEDGMPIQEFSVPVGHCHAREHVRFSCSVGGGKVVSLCDSADGLSYRFGRVKQIELQLPAEGERADTVPFELSRRTLGEDAELHVLTVWNGAFRYAIHSERTEDMFEGGLVVRDLAKVVATLPCAGQPTVDFTGTTGRHEGSLDDPRAWVGVWKGEGVEAELTVAPPPPDPKAKGDVPADPFATLAVTGEATWHGAGDVIHTGEVDGPLVREGREMKLVRSDDPDADGCALTLRRMVANTLYVEDNGQCGGMNVTFTGTYHREP